MYLVGTKDSSKNELKGHLLMKVRAACYCVFDKCQNTHSSDYSCHLQKKDPYNGKKESNEKEIGLKIIVHIVALFVARVLQIKIFCLNLHQYVVEDSG